LLIKKKIAVGTPVLWAYQYVCDIGVGKMRLIKGY